MTSRQRPVILGVEWTHKEYRWGNMPSYWI